MMVSSPDGNIKNTRLPDCHLAGFYLPESWQSGMAYEMQIMIL